MVDVRELRIGNLIKHINRNGEFNLIVKQIFETAIDVEYNHGNWTLNDSEIEPIPLTEEWLLKFGFERREYNGGHCFAFLVDEYNVFELSKGDSWEKYIWSVTGRNEDMINEPSVTVENVHQLQNLYFSLTGKEINVKL